MPEHADCAALPAAAHLARVEVRTRGARTVVAVDGEADMDAGLRWERELCRALDDSAQGLELDLRALRFCDPMGLAVLLRVRHAALAAGKTVTIRSASPLLTRLLHLTHTHALFTDAPGRARSGAADGPPAATAPAIPQQHPQGACQPEPASVRSERAGPARAGV